MLSDATIRKEILRGFDPKIEHEKICDVASSHWKSIAAAMAASIDMQRLFLSMCTFAREVDQLEPSAQSLSHLSFQPDFQ